MLDLEDGLREELRGEVGGSLRSIATYDQDGYEVRFIREDVEARYSAEEIEAVYGDLVLAGISREYYEHLFHAGGLECAMYGFEDATMFHFVVSETDGLFVSIDRNVELNLERVIQACTGAIEAAP